jgi:coenzyme Q-binding protein COQ10
VRLWLVAKEVSVAKFHLNRVLPYSADKLFDMVGDVERYPEFVPWINSLRTFNVSRPSDDITRFDADVAVGFSFLTERFTTRVTRFSENKTIDIVLLKGPFKRLHCTWKFSDQTMSNGKIGAAIDFNIDFEFKNPFLDGFLRANFDKAVSKLMACFEGRAQALYPTV